MAKMSTKIVDSSEVEGDKAFPILSGFSQGRSIRLAPQKRWGRRFKEFPKPPLPPWEG